MSVNFDLDFVRHGTIFVSSIRKLVRNMKISVRHRSRAGVVTVQRAAEDFFSGRSAPGDIVSIEGFLSKYVLTHRQDFHSYYAHRVTEHTHTIDPESALRGMVKVHLNIAAVPNQCPVQAVPPIMLNGKLVYIYFLYPPNIDSFLLRVDEEKEKEKNEGKLVETILNFNEEVRPILVLAPKPITGQREKVVKLTGVLAEADETVADQFLKSATGIQQTILNNALRPFSERAASFCIDLREVSELEERSEKEALSAILYVESHMENIAKIDNYQKLLGESLPGAFPGMHWMAFGKDQVTWGLSESEVFIASIDYSRFAFFIETNLCNEAVYQNSLKKLHAFSEVFRKRVQNHARKEHGVELKNKYDFLFDYSKARLFHPDGVLVSKELEQALEQSPDLLGDVAWLRGAG